MGSAIGTSNVDGYSRTESGYRRLPPAIGTALIGIVVGLLLGIVVAAATPLYAIAGLIGLAGLACIFADVRFGLFGYVGVATLLPFATIPVSLGPVKPTLLDVALVSVLLVWIFRLLADRRETLRPSGIDLPVLLYLGVCATSFVLGTAYQTTTSDARLFAELVDATVFLFSIVNTVRDLTAVRRLMIGLVAGGATSGLIGIVLYDLPATTSTSLLVSLSRIGYPASDVLQYIASTSIQRAIGTSIDPNIFGATLMMCGVIAVGLCVEAPTVTRKVWLLIPLGLMLVALLLTYSRGSLIGFLAGCAVIATLRSPRLWIVGGVVVVAVLLFGELSQSNFITHLQSGIEVRDQAAAMRLGEYQDAFRLIQEYPWFGVGFGEAPDVDLYVGVSSIYLLIAEQVGLIGLAIWSWIMATVLVRGIRLGIERHDEASTLGVVCLGALVSALVAGLFDHHFVDMHFPHVVAMVWMIVGLLCVCLRPLQSPG